MDLRAGTDGKFVAAAGWAMNPTLPGGGIPPVQVKLVVRVGDALPYTVTTLANLSRPDLVKAGIVPNPFHGFSVKIALQPALTAALTAAATSSSSAPPPTPAASVVGATNVTVIVDAYMNINSNSSPELGQLGSSPKCLCGPLHHKCPCTL